MPKTELTLAEKLSKIQVEFKSNKSRFNSFGKYNFRSAEDILEGLKPFNEKYGVYFTIREEVSVIFETTPILISTATIHDNNEINEIEATAIVGVDLQQKGMQVPQQFGSASSYGKKYALGNLLLIDDTQDADATNTGSAKNATTEPVDEKKFLNKNTPEFNKAIEYLKNGGNFTAIENKYKMNKEVRSELLKIK